MNQEATLNRPLAAFMALSRLETLRILIEVGQGPGRSAQALGQAIGATEVYVRRHLSDMERYGLVIHEGTGFERRHYFRVTPAGRIALDLVRSFQSDAQQEPS